MQTGTTQRTEIGNHAAERRGTWRNEITPGFYQQWNFRSPVLVVKSDMQPNESDVKAQPESPRRIEWKAYFSELGFQVPEIRLTEEEICKLPSDDVDGRATCVALLVLMRGYRFIKNFQQDYLVKNRAEWASRLILKFTSENAANDERIRSSDVDVLKATTNAMVGRWEKQIRARYRTLLDFRLNFFPSDSDANLDDWKLALIFYIGAEFTSFDSFRAWANRQAQKVFQKASKSAEPHSALGKLTRCLFRSFEQHKRLVDGKGKDIPNFRAYAMKIIENESTDNLLWADSRFVGIRRQVPV